MKMTTLVQAVNPGRLRREMKSGQTGGVTILSDGNYLWMYLQALRRYTKRDIHATGLDGLGGEEGLYKT